MTDDVRMGESTPSRLALAVREILAEAQAMANGPQSHPRYGEYAGDIADSAAHLLAIVSEPAGAAGSGAIVDVVEVADRARAMMAMRAADKRLRLPPVISPPLHARADMLRTLQILVNLLGNAVKFTPESGFVTVRCGRAGQHVFVDVEDSGPGISPDVQCRMFQPFERSAQSTGVGLGLAISRDLAREMGGDLAQLPSETGAAFRLTLPAA